MDIRKSIVTSVAALCLTSQPAHSAPSETVTPKGYTVLARGGCLIARARQGIDASPVDYKWCNNILADNLAASKFQDLYAWAPDFLIEAFNNAERVVCPGNSLGCVVNGRAVEIIIVSDGFANAYIQRSDSRIRVVVTSGLVDFSEAANLAYLDDAHAVIFGDEIKNGFNNWIQSIDKLEGKPCVFRALSPLHNLSETQFIELRTASQAFFEFVMGHELAHARARDCHATVPITDLSREIVVVK